MKHSAIVWHLAGASAVYAAVAMTATGHLSPLAALAPVPAANADERPPKDKSTEAAQTIDFVEPCSHTMGTGPSAQHFAEHVFPSGRKAMTLGRVHVLGHYAKPGSDVPEGYTHTMVTAGVYVRDGSVAVMCGRDGDSHRFDSVYMIFPKHYVIDLDLAYPLDQVPIEQDDTPTPTFSL